MSNRNITSSAYVGAVFAQTFDDEPPMSLDLAQIERTGARRLRRWRAFTMGGAALVVAAVTVGIAVSVPSLSARPAVNSPAPVPGCATALSTGDPAVLAWRNGGLTSAPTSAHAPSAASSSSAAEAPTRTAPSTRVVAPAWFTPAKAAAMQQSLRAALPAGVQLSAVQSADSPAGLPFRASDGAVSGGGLLTAGINSASLLISVQPWSLGAPPCTEDLTLRITGVDGTITDVVEQIGTGHSMLAESFRTDGTIVQVNLGIGAPLVQPNQALPLTARQLAALAANPDFAISQH